MGPSLQRLGMDPANSCDSDSNGKNNQHPLAYRIKKDEKVSNDFHNYSEDILNWSSQVVNTLKSTNILKEIATKLILNDLKEYPLMNEANKRLLDVTYVSYYRDIEDLSLSLSLCVSLSVSLSLCLGLCLCLSLRLLYMYLYMYIV